MIEQEIISDVADIYGITVDNIISRRRIRKYVDARVVVSYVLYYFRSVTLMEIGKRLNRSHASIIYFNRKADDWMRMPAINDEGYKAIKKLKEKYGKS